MRVGCSWRVQGRCCARLLAASWEGLWLNGMKLCVRRPRVQHDALFGSFHCGVCALRGGQAYLTLSILPPLTPAAAIV